MVTGADVQNIARRNFEQARANKQADLAKTSTPAEAREVEDNYEAAMAAHLETLIAGFEAASGNWDQLRDEAEAAETALDQARAKAQGAAATITALGNLTGAVAKLVEAAK